MTSGGGGGEGAPKSRHQEQNQLICDSDKEGVKKSENFADVIYGSPLEMFRFLPQPGTFGDSLSHFRNQESAF